ncbi:MAG: hypothetical protein DDT29_01519 [Dehalococcoidia bacterium]|nr:hypothetical protein [Bacillota bacterium]
MKILVGIALLGSGGLLTYLSFTALAVTKDVGMGFTVTTFNTPVMILGSVIMAAGGIWLTWAIYQWERRKAAETIAEGIRKAQEKK